MHFIDAECNQVLRNRDQRRQSRNAQEQEEDETAHHAVFHVQEDAGKCDENQSRSLSRRDAVCEAARENDESGADRDKGVERNDNGRLLRQRLRLGDVASADCDAADAETERKERLCHRRMNRRPETALLKSCNTRHEEEFQTFGSVRQTARLNGESDEQQEQSRHHELGHALHTRLESGDADRHGDRNCNVGKKNLPAGAGKEAVKESRHAIRSDLRKGAGCKIPGIGEQPAGDDRVEHQKNEIAGKEQHSGLFPRKRTLRILETLVAADQIELTRASDGKFHHHDRESKQDKEEKIHQDKDCTAVLSADIREAPDVAQTDRTSRSQQDEAQTGRKHFASARRLCTHKKPLFDCCISDNLPHNRQFCKSGIKFI